MQIIIQRPELKYSYEICDPTRDPTKPGSLQERMKADRVFKEVVAKVNEKYELIRASFITSEKYITVSWGKPQSFDTAPCVAVLLPDFGSTGRLPGSDRF